MLETSEINFKNDIEMINKRLGEMRLENHKYAFELQKKSSELNVEYEKILEIKKEVYTNLDNTVNKMENMHKDTRKEFDDYTGEFTKIKNKFVELSEFIKDIRFKKNAHLETSERREIKAFANRLAFNETGVRADKRSSTIQYKHINLNDLDKGQNQSGDSSSPDKHFLEDKTNEIFTNLDGQIEPIIYETEDRHEETYPDDKRDKNKTSKDLLTVDSKSDIYRPSLTGSKFLIKNNNPDVSKRQDTCGNPDSPMRHTVTDILNPSALNNFKYEVCKKTTDLERRIIEVEHNAKKKLEELTAQLKIFIPSINFNPYVKRTEKTEKIDKLPQVNVENLILHNNAGPNFSLNIMDPSSLINTVYSNQVSKKFTTTTQAQPKRQSNLHLNAANNVNKDYYANVNVNVIGQSKSATESKPATKNIK
jgi:hypothetical protein